MMSSLVLFGPSLFLLGCVSPYVVKIAAREMGACQWSGVPIRTASMSA